MGAYRYHVERSGRRRRRYGGFYSTADLARLVSYCEVHGVRVVPVPPQLVRHLPQLLAPTLTPTPTLTLTLTLTRRSMCPAMWARCLPRTRT